MTYGAQIDVVADTNIVVALFSNNESEEEIAQLYRPHLEGKAVGLSFQTEAELRVQQLAQGWDDDNLRSILSRFDIVPWSPELSEQYVFLRSESISRSRRRGTRQERRRIGPADGWIAATAMLLGCPLVTHDRHLADNGDIVDVITEL